TGTSYVFSLEWPAPRWKPVIGIDLGTTYTYVGVYKHKRFEIIANDQGNLSTPSWVAFTDVGRLIGEPAKNQAAINPERTIFDVKRLIGRKFEDEEVQRLKKLVPYNIVSKEGKPCIEVKIKGEETMVFSPEEISAMILTKMKETAEAYLREKVKDVVLTVPAYFNDAQRQAMKDAGIIAGLNVARIIDEPTAAAIAYGLDWHSDEKNILVFHLGGGTLDVSILSVKNGNFEVLATNGDAHLGGKDFDQRIMTYLIRLIKKKHGKDISKDNRALGKLKIEAERAKRALSTELYVRVEIESLFDGTNISEPFTRARFEELNNDLFNKTMEPVKKAMKDAGLEKHQIDEIVLVGGSTWIPRVQMLLKDYFDGKEPKWGVSPDEAVAYGASVQGNLLNDPTGTMLSREELIGMIREAEKCHEEDDRVRMKIQARRRLETYLYNMKNQTNDKDKLADDLESEEKEKIDTAVKEALEWLNDNQSAEKEDYDNKLEDLDAFCNPIIIAVYQRSVCPSGAGTNDKDSVSRDEL
ncbi:luminal-binding protein 5, partial [Daucus carota subsp. sativus]|uniref:luminal-binding protein 5 n=1 Tax=Daucus carota subsp. sativus TaxID=79200 RepID=UPI0007F02BF7